MKTEIIVLDESSTRDYQKEVLKVAKDVIAFFDDNDIRYSLSGGSILGAVRHKGFIPWDDDIDLNIPRADYDKMVRLFDEKIGSEYYLQTPTKCPGMGLMVTQIRKRGTIARRKFDITAEECGISVDLYVIENVYDEPAKRFIQEKMCMFLTSCISAVRFYNNRFLPREIQGLEARAFQHPQSKMVFGRLLRIIPLSKWIRWCEYWNSVCNNSQTRLVSIPSGRKHFSGEIYKRSDMCVYKKAAFEDTEFNIPIWAEGYLSFFYGDYMKLPPVEKREKHVFLELKY